MNLADVQVELFDVWGRPLTGRIDVEEKRGAGGSHWIAAAEVPGFKRDRAVLDMNGRATMILLMDPDECDVMDPAPAALALFLLKMRNSWVAGRSIMSFVGEGSEPIHVQADRAFFRLFDDDDTLAAALKFSGAWKSVPGGMHSPPGGRDWEQVGSWKSLDRRLNLQATIWTGGPSWGGAQMFVEVDIDRNTGAKHTWDALIRHPLIGQDDPRVLAQLLVYFEGLQLPFAMVPLADIRS